MCINELPIRARGCKLHMVQYHVLEAVRFASTEVARRKSGWQHWKFDSVLRHNAPTPDQHLRLGECVSCSCGQATTCPRWLVLLCTPPAGLWLQTSAVQAKLTSTQATLSFSLMQNQSFKLQGSETVLFSGESCAYSSQVSATKTFKRRLLLWAFLSPHNPK